MATDRRASRTIVVDEYRKLTVPVSSDRCSPTRTHPPGQRRMSTTTQPSNLNTPCSKVTSSPRSPSMERRMSKNLPFLVVRDGNLTEEQLSEIIASFEMIDLNSDGRISKGELIKAAAVLGMNPTEEDARAMMSLADLDGDGFIDFEEYKNMMKHNYQEIDLEKERLLAAFRVLDRDNDGLLSRDELKAALTFQAPPMDKMDVESFLEDADSNGDGMIDYDEFVTSKLCTKVFA